MTIQKILTVVISLFFLSGCSALKERLFPRPAAITTSNSLSYDFITPRRASLTPDLISKYRLPSSASDKVNGFTYFSANGNRCQTLSLSSPKVACMVNDRWVEAAPVLIGNIPR